VGRVISGVFEGAVTLVVELDDGGGVVAAAVVVDMNVGID